MKHINVSAVLTGAHSIHFRHGREAYPGQFFAVQELELLIAPMIMNHDTQPLA